MVSQPEYPDPKETAAAQSGMNRDSVISSALINNYNESTPFGSVQYNQGGTRNFTDSQGNPVEVPYFNRNVTLSAPQQQMLDNTNTAGINLSSMAAGTTGILKDYLSQPFDPNYNYSYDTSTATPDQREWVDYTPQQIAAMSQPGAQGSQGGGYTPGTFKPSMTFDEWANKGYQDNNYSKIFGPLDGQSYSFAPTQGEYQKFVDNERTNFDAEQRNAYTDYMMNGGSQGQAQAQPYQGPGGYWRTTPGDTGTLRKVEKTGANAIRDWADYGVKDYSDDRRRVEDAIMSRYDRQFSDTEAALDQKLRNQGLMPGSEAYDTQFRQMREMQNDATMQAILAGGQEQSRLAGLDLGAANFQNNTRQSQMQEALALRNQPINEAIALMSGSQVQVPQFVSPFQAGVQAPDYTGLVNNKYQADSKAAAASAQGLFGILGAIPGMFKFGM